MEIESVIPGPLPHLGFLNGFMFGVQKSNPALLDIAKCSSLGADDRSNIVYEIVVERGTQQDGHGKGRRAVEVSCGRIFDSWRRGDAVQCLLPPLIRRQAETLHSSRVVASVVDFFLDGHRPYEGLGSVGGSYESTHQPLKTQPEQT